MPAGSRRVTIEVPREEEMSKPTTWMSLEELEGMERRMRRLLEAPIATTAPAPVTRKPLRRPPTTSRRSALFTHQPADALVKALKREHVSYELVPHRHTETALAEAEALHVAPHQVAKTLILNTPFGHVRAVLRAVDRLDLVKARSALGTAEVELASEVDLVGAYPEFELGAVPPVGGAYDRVLVDERVFDSPFVVFEAGTHDESIRLRPGELLSVAEAEVADLADEAPDGEEES
jgi:Ala-tRNA(Pro) deacylase